MALPHCCGNRLVLPCLAVVAIVLGAASTFVLPDDLRYAGMVVIWLMVLAGYGRILIDRVRARRAS